MTKSQKKPKGVPDSARWDAEGYWAEGALDENGEKHGPYRYWNTDGVFYCRNHYEHGLAHGENVHLHPDGTLGQRCNYQHGAPSDLDFWRADVPTSVGFVEGAGEAVWHARFLCNDGLTNRALQFFLRDGTEVAVEGSPLPPRPTTVAMLAHYLANQERWVAGATMRSTGKRIGALREWSKEGKLLTHSEYDGQGELRLELECFEEDGSLQKRTLHDEEGRRREREEFHAREVRSALTRWDENENEIYGARWDRDGVLYEGQSSRFEGERLVSRTERRAGGQTSLLVAESSTPGSLSCALFDEAGRLEAQGLAKRSRLYGSWQLFAEGKLESTLDLGPTPTDDEQSEAVEDEVEDEGDDAEALEDEGEDTLETEGFDESEDEDNYVAIEYDAISWKLAAVSFGVWLAAHPASASDDGLDWENVSGAYGSDAQLPNYFRALGATEAQTRRYALGMIANSIEHQGSVYPATAKSIPFLVAALDSPYAEHSEILRLLRIVGEAAAPYREEVAELDADEEGRIAIEGTLSALAAAWPVFRSRLSKATDVSAQRQLLHLAKFGPSADAVLDGVHALVQSKDAELRACVADVTVQLGAPEDRVVHWFDDEDRLVRTVAAVALASKQGNSLSGTLQKRVEAALVDALSDLDTLSPRYANVRPDDAELPAMLAVAASLIRSPALQDLAPALSTHLATANGFGAADVFARGLLQLVLGAEATPPFSSDSLTVLTAVAESEPVWLFNVNAAEALQAFGLPATREELRALINELKATANPNGLLDQRLAQARAEDAL